MPKSKSTAKKKSAAKKAAAKKAPAKKKVAAKKAVAKKSTAKKAAAKKATSKKAAAKKGAKAKKAEVTVEPVNRTPKSTHPAAFIKKQNTRLLELRDAMLDSMIGVARDNLRSRAEGNEASAFGMHQADAGSDSYDRDFALNLLSQEQDALYEIDEALKRVEEGTYGMCEISGEKIPQARLEAMPFARCTVACQTQLENEAKNSNFRRQAGSLFGLTDGESSGSDDDRND